jgi:hypothetical protein
VGLVLFEIRRKAKLSADLVQFLGGGRGYGKFLWDPPSSGSGYIGIKILGPKDYPAVIPPGQINTPIRSVQR